MFWTNIAFSNNFLMTLLTITTYMPFRLPIHCVHILEDTYAIQWKKFNVYKFVINGTCDSETAWKKLSVTFPLISFLLMLTVLLGTDDDVRMDTFSIYFSSPFIFWYVIRASTDFGLVRKMVYSVVHGYKKCAGSLDFCGHSKKTKQQKTTQYLLNRTRLKMVKSGHV